MINPEKILTERITHELDMDLLRELEKALKVDLSKEIGIAERKFHDKLDRVIKDMTNDKVHETDNL